MMRGNGKGKKKNKKGGRAKNKGMGGIGGMGGLGGMADMMGGGVFDFGDMNESIEDALA